MGAQHSTQSTSMKSSSDESSFVVESAEVFHGNSSGVECTDETWEDFLEERCRILEDARNLKQYATFYLHPEIPVESGMCSRCYFNRPSAPQQESRDDVEEKYRIMEECHALRNYAGLYLHPECRDPTQVHELEPEREDERLAREQVIQDAMLLKQYATFYLHPELPVITTDPTACARCYFDRPSAPEQESREEMEEHTHILEELELLKTYAKFYLHPEVPVKTNDFAACERCYFDRPSAPERNSWEEAEERHQILSDAAKLEVLAQLRLHEHLLERDYFHCKYALDADPVHVEHDDPIKCEPESEDERLAREQVIQDAMLLKQYATFYLHPELPVITTDPTACARCYFDRQSAPEQESHEEMEEHTHILEEIELLKTYAKFYLHPEVPVKTNDFAACERCYFDRPSAPERNSWEEAEERHQILSDAAKLEVLAQLRLHEHLLERDYFHCKYALDADPVHFEHDDPIQNETENGKVGFISSGDEECQLSRSPSSIFGFA